jgi:phosphatidylserine/phosphatidylglycerophosphate/cardiolipin synthase-like enzyme
MFNQTVAFRQYLKNRDEQINAEKTKDSKIRNLFNEKNFYQEFTKDMLAAKKEVIIYSPFASKFRTDDLKATIERLRKRNIEIFIFTRPISDYESIFQPQIECSLKRYEDIGVNIYYLGGNIHEKVAIIDREILWEGSLNILSQRSSKEMMRKVSDEESAMQIIAYLGLNKRLAESYKTMYEKMYRSLVADSDKYKKLRIRIFFAGLIIPIIAWLIFTVIREISPFLKWIELLAKTSGSN